MHSMRIGQLLFLACGLLLTASVSAADKPQVLSVKKIWDSGQHNAFTDLVRFQGKWFCTFRESEAHVGGDGKVRVLFSTDGENWDTAALLREAGVDLRDPKFSITPDNRLMLTLGGSIYEGKKLKGRQPRVAFSRDGRSWSAPQRVMAEGDWLWRVTWNRDCAYGISYVSSSPATPAKDSQPVEWMAKLVESTNGVDYRLVKVLDVPGRPNEGTLRFLENGDCIALLRRETQDKAAWIGTSRPPYTDWKWKPAGLFIGGPNFIQLPTGEFVAGGRQMDVLEKGAKMFVGSMKPDAVTPQLILPSGGDCSYPGLVFENGALWVSYYSSHEGKSSIYLAKVKWPGVGK